MNKIEYHRKRIKRILDEVALRVVLCKGSANLVKTKEIASFLTESEMAGLIVSAHALAEQTP